MQRDFRFLFSDDFLLNRAMNSIFSSLKNGLKVSALFLTIAGMSFSAFSGDIPEGFQLIYSQDFDCSESMEDFEMSDPAAWKFSTNGKGSGALELHKASDYRARVRSPFNIALIRGHQFGDFIMELDMQQTGREYGHRDMCLFFAVKDPTNFYYVHMATVADPNAHNVFLVNDEPRRNIAKKTTDGVEWGTEIWRHVRLERTVADGKIRVFFDDMKTPIMEADDTHFDFGRIGVGSFDDTGKVDNIRIWAPSLAPDKEGFFR